MMTRKTRIALRFPACAALLALSLLMSACGGAGGTSTTQTPVTRSTASPRVAIFLRDNTSEQVLAARVDINSAQLAGSSSTDIITSTRAVELKHLDMAPTLVHQGLINTGSYTAVNLTLANPRLSVADSRGNILQVLPTTTPSVRLAATTATVPVTFSAQGEDSIGVMLDWNLRQAITVDPSGNFVISPTIRASLVVSSDTKPEIVDTLGRVTSVDRAANRMNVQLISNGQTIAVSVNSGTVFDTSLASFAGVQVNQVVDLDAKLQADGTFLAHFVNLGPADPALAFQGLVTQAFVDTTGKFVFDAVLQ